MTNERLDASALPALLSVLLVPTGRAHQAFAL